MSGCVVGLIWNMIAFTLLAIIRIIGLMLILMVTSVASLFVGVEAAVERIAYSWIEQITGSGINVGYNPVTRESMKVAAVLMLMFGWLLDIGVLYLIIWLVINNQ